MGWAFRTWRILIKFYWQSNVDVFCRISNLSLLGSLKPSISMKDQSSRLNWDVYHPMFGEAFGWHEISLRRANNGVLVMVVRYVFGKISGCLIKNRLSVLQPR